MGEAHDKIWQVGEEAETSQFTGWVTTELAGHVREKHAH